MPARPSTLASGERSSFPIVGEIAAAHFAALAGDLALPLRIHGGKTPFGRRTLNVTHTDALQLLPEPKKNGRRIGSFAKLTRVRQIVRFDLCARDG